MSGLRAAWIVFRKELLDVLRDRRTLIFMVLIPTLAVPGVMWLMSELMSSMLEKMARERADVLVLGAEAAPELVEELRARSSPMGVATAMAQVLIDAGLGESDLALIEDEGPEALRRLLERQGADPERVLGELRQIAGTEEFEPAAASVIALAFPPNFRLITELPSELGDPRDPQQREAVLLEAVRTDRLAAAIELPPDTRERLAAGDSVTVPIYYLDSSDRSSMALRSLRNIINSQGQRIVAQRLLERELPAGLAQPLALRPRRLPGPGMLVKIMSQLLPYLILIFAFLGALYPAIDLGAGEKERGTLETLLVAPVSRLALVLGKFGVVLLTAMVSAVLATVSLSVSLQVGFLGNLAVLSGGSFSFDPAEAAAALLLVLPVGAVFAALLLALSIYAKSFKEGQNYAGPLQMVIILPAIVSFLPGVKLDWFTASLPLVNVSLALKEIFTGNLDQHWPHVGVIFLSTAAFAGVLLWFATWWFRREQVLFRS